MAVPFLEHFTGADELPQMMHVPPPAGLVPDTHDPLKAFLWLGATLLYFISALLYAGRDPRAILSYVIALSSNVILFFIDHRPPPSGTLMVFGAGLALIAFLMHVSDQSEDVRS